MSFTSNEETTKYNNIRKIKYSTTEQKHMELYTKGAFDWEIRISISDFGFWISQ